MQATLFDIDEPPKVEPPKVLPLWESIALASVLDEPGRSAKELGTTNERLRALADCGLAREEDGRWFPTTAAIVGRIES